MAQPGEHRRQDAIDVIMSDHRSVDRLFDLYENLNGDDDVRRGLVDDMIRELSIHASIEEQHFYPAVREHLEAGDELVEESLDEHQMVKELLASLEDTDVDDPRFDERVTMLIREVRHHVREEEEEILPGLRQKLGEDALLEIGEKLEAAKAEAPTHPHPEER